MVHTIALETGEWEVEAEAAEVFLVLRLEIAIHKFTLETNVLGGVWNSEVFLYFFVARYPGIQTCLLKEIGHHPT